MAFSSKPRATPYCQLARDITIYLRASPNRLRRPCESRLNARAAPAAQGDGAAMRARRPMGRPCCSTFRSPDRQRRRAWRRSASRSPPPVSAKAGLVDTRQEARRRAPCILAAIAVRHRQCRVRRGRACQRRRRDARRFLSPCCRTDSGGVRCALRRAGAGARRACAVDGRRLLHATSRGGVHHLTPEQVPVSDLDDALHVEGRTAGEGEPPRRPARISSPRAAKLRARCLLRRSARTRRAPAPMSRSADRILRQALLRGGRRARRSRNRDRAP